jgi:hypothetical protein
MPPKPPSAPNPKRVAAGRRNRCLRGPLSLQGQRRLRLAALWNKPWLFSTGPQTPEGKARSATNGRWRQKGAISDRQTHGSVVDMGLLIKAMTAARRLLG